MRKVSWALGLATAALLLWADRAPGGGLTNTDTFGGFQFNFNNPGARALGMGGAFVAVADDATAVVTNPAGLVILQRPEVSAEAKFTQFTNTVRGFSETSTPTAPSVFSKNFTDEVTTPSFFSFVYPTEHVVLGAFIREEVNFASHFLTRRFEQASPGGAFSFFPVKSDLDITVVNFGLAAGINLEKVHPLIPNIGASLELSHGTVRSRLDRFDFEPTTLDADRIFATTLVDGSDIGVGFNVGVLWHPWSTLGVGAVYRRGPAFNMRQRVDNGPAAIGSFGILPPSLISDFRLKVPDVYGVGISYRFFDRLTVSIDVDRVLYSQLLDGFQVLFPSFRAPILEKDFHLRDATEVHVGAEYVFFVRSMLFALRAGVYTDPDHKIRYVGPDSVSRVFFPGGKDVVHYTGGFGVSPIPGLQFDFATSQSETVKEFSVSTVFRF